MELVLKTVFSTTSQRNIAERTLIAVGLLALIVLLLAPLQQTLNATTIGLALLSGVLFAAIYLSRWPALAASVVAMLGYNFFFLPPILRITIADPQNRVALAAFTVTAVVTGELSARARQRALEADASRQEVERLYK